LRFGIEEMTLHMQLAVQKVWAGSGGIAFTKKNGGVGQKRKNQWKKGKKGKFLKKWNTS